MNGVRAEWENNATAIDAAQCLSTTNTSIIVIILIPLHLLLFLFLSSSSSSICCRLIAATADVDSRSA